MRFILSQDNRSNWNRILNNLLTTVSGNRKDDFEITPVVFSKKTQNQLKGFWVLISIVRDWMNDEGNTFTKEEVASYFKIEAGHYVNIFGVKNAKSISNRSSCTKKQMKEIINKILDFGLDNKIKGCEMQDAELETITNYFYE